MNLLIWLTCHPLLALAIDGAFVAACYLIRHLIPPLEEML